jgi:hypothetical protein
MRPWYLKEKACLYGHRIWKNSGILRIVHEASRGCVYGHQQAQRLGAFLAHSRPTIFTPAGSFFIFKLNNIPSACISIQFYLNSCQAFSASDLLSHSIRIDCHGWSMHYIFLWFLYFDLKVFNPESTSRITSHLISFFLPGIQVWQPYSNDGMTIILHSFNSRIFFFIAGKV